ncbi:MAG: protein serine/threonine phosphatase with GAF(s) sensor(s), partial [Planctomycetota bacterium]
MDKSRVTGRFQTNFRLREFHGFRDSKTDRSASANRRMGAGIVRAISGRREHVAASIVDSDCCWQAEVRDGENLVGQLRLEAPHDPRADRSFMAVSQLSAIFAELVDKVFAANHRLAEGTHELAALVHLGLTVPKGSELLVAIQQLLRAGLQLTSFRSACLFLLEPASEELRLRATHHLDARDVPHSARPLRGDPPDLHVMSSGTRIVIRRGDRQSDEWLPADAALGFCLPVQTPSGVLGTLWFFDRRPRTIESGEKQLLDSLGMQMASLLERAVLQRESATHQRLRHELLSLGDSEADSPIKTLKNAKLEAAWRVGSRFEIGGDLCEAIELSDHEIAILIGDATGDSVPAAVVMTAVHGALAALLTGDPDDARDTGR